MTLRVTVWGAYAHKKTHQLGAELYPRGMHGCIADALNTDPQIRAVTAMLEQQALRNAVQWARPEGHAAWGVQERPVAKSIEPIAEFGGSVH